MKQSTTMFLPSIAFKVGDAHYADPPVDRSAEIEAEDPQRAMMKALLEHKVPAKFEPDGYGWMAPVYWHPDLAGRSRWPIFRRVDTVTWGKQGSKGRGK